MQLLALIFGCRFAFTLDNIPTVRYTDHMQEHVTRKRILQHAVQLFTDHGYDSVGVQQLCETSGITKPTLYHHFGNKRGVLEAATQSCTQQFLQELATSLEYHGDMTNSLTLIIDTLLSLTRENRDGMRMLLSLQHAPRKSESRKAAESFFSELATSLEQLFTAAAQDHGNMRGRQQAYAVSFMAVLFGYVELVLDEKIQLTDQLTHRIMHQFAHGIYS